MDTVRIKQLLWFTDCSCYHIVCKHSVLWYTLLKNRAQHRWFMQAPALLTNQMQAQVCWTALTTGDRAASSITECSALLCYALLCCVVLQCADPTATANAVCTCSLSSLLAEMMTLAPWRARYWASAAPRPCSNMNTAARPYRVLIMGQHCSLTLQKHQHSNKSHAGCFGTAVLPSWSGAQFACSKPCKVIPAQVLQPER